MSWAVSRKNLWERAPAPVRTTVGALLGVLPPQAIFGSRFRRQLRWLEDAQWWTEEKNREYQLAEVQKLCLLAQERTSYYRELFRSAGFDPRDLKRPEDLGGLPTLNRQTLRDRLGDMCAVAVPSSRVDYVSTGGTGGEPVRFYINGDRSSVEYAYLVSGWQRADFKLGTPLAVLRGKIVRPNRSGLHHEYDPLLRCHYYSSFHLTQREMARYLEHIASIGPCFLHVYPSSAAALARYLRGAGRPGPSNVMGVLAESEAVLPEDHELVRQIFRCRYSASYGLTEKVVAATACEQSNDYHVWPTYGFFELLDAKGRPITTPGARGEIVGTGFINKVVPFIRYRTGDYATYVGSHCQACGRAHPIITDIRGRRPQEWLVAADDSLIAWTALNMHDDSFDNVLRFQFLQNTPGRATLNVVPAEAFSNEDAARIQRNLEAKLDGAIALTIEVVESIRLSPAGKAIYVDQRLPIVL
jgi:phenylacetate-CoA ligase